MNILCRLGIHKVNRVYRYGWPRYPINPISAVSVALHTVVYGWQEQGRKCCHCGKRTP